MRVYAGSLSVALLCGAGILAAQLVAGADNFRSLRTAIMVADIVLGACMVAVSQRG